MKTIRSLYFKENSRDRKTEESLLSLSYVKECIAYHRTSLSGNESLLVAYISTTQPVTSSDLDKYLQGINDAIIPDAYVFISALPLTPKGMVDYDALFTFPVFDKDTKNKLQFSIHSLEKGLKTSIEEDYVDAPKDKSTSLLKPFKKPETSNHRMVETPLSHKLAISHGESLDKNTLVNSIDTYLVEAAKNQTKGIHFPKRNGDSVFLTYAELYKNALKAAGGLETSDCKPNDIVVLAVDDQELFLKIFWGCALSNITVLPMAALTNDDPNSVPVKKLQAVLKTLSHPWVIVENKNLSLFNAVLPESSQNRVLNAEDLIHSSPMKKRPVISAKNTALFLLTSGSTGTPKIVTQTHEALIHRSHASALANNFQSQDIFLNWFPLDHVGGIVMFHLQALCVSASQVLSPMGRILHKPLEWLDLIHQYQATVTWAPNFAYSLVNEALKHAENFHWDLSSMRFILNGGEAINAEQVHLFMRNLEPYGLSPKCMHPSWGMSETCSGVAFTNTVKAQNFSGAEAVIIGKAIPGISFRIVNESGNLMKEGEIGDLHVQGKPVTQGYYSNPEANKNSFTSDGWFITGDRAAMINEMIAITGREKDVIIINGLNHSCAEIESYVDSISGVKASHTAAIGIRDGHATTDKLAIFFVPNTEENLLETIHKIRTSVAETFHMQADHIVPVQAQDLPRTSIGKIQRSLLKVRFEEGFFTRTLRLLNQNTYLNKESFQVSWHPKTLFSPTQNNHTALVLTSSLDQIPSLKEQQTHIFQWHSDEDHQSQLVKLEQFINQESITAIIDLRSFDSHFPQITSTTDVEKIQTHHAEELIELLKRLSAIPSVKSYICCSNYAQFVFEGDKVIPAKSGLLGILKAFNFESPALQTRYIDVDESVDFSLVLHEIHDTNKDTEIAYRNGVRYVRTLKQFRPNPAVHENAIQHNGFYIITGGLGGIGFELAKTLLAEYNSRVLLIGQTQMPARHLWQQYLEDGLEEAKKIKNFKHLQNIGKNRVIYASGDLCNEKFVEETLSQACEFYKDLPDGIFHLAGKFEEQSIQSCDRKHLQRVLNAKTLGAWNLLQSATKFDKSIHFVTFSSANGYFAGPNLAAYSCANIFLDQLSYQTHKHIHHHCFAWSMWNDLGMSENYSGKELTKIKGYEILEPKSAIECLFDGMAQNVRNLIVGIDKYNPYMQCHIGQPSQTLKEVKVTCPSPKTVEKLIETSSNIVDLFGHKLTIHFHNQSTETKKSAHSSPADITKVLTEIWEQVLDLKELNIDDNFFDLGGHSLVLIKVQESVRDRLNINIEMVELFKYPTIRTLSQKLSENPITHVNIQETLMSIWADTLECDDISLESNFFDLGGHSMIMIKVHERIKSELKVDIEIIDLFKHPTLKALATYIKEKVT